MRKKLLLISFIISGAFSTLVQAQDKEVFYDREFNVHYIYTKANNSLGFSSFGLGISYLSKKDFGISYESSYLFLSDAFWEIKNLVTSSHPDYPKSFITSNVIGVQMVGLNVYNTDKWTVSAGLNLGSYFLQDVDSKRSGDGRTDFKIIGVGSYVRADYFINDVFMARVRNTLSFPVYIGESKTYDGGKIMQTDFELAMKQGVYISTELLNLVGGPSTEDKYLRTNFKIGFRFEI